jgi:nitroreductase
MDLDRAIKERQSIRKFNSKTPDWRKILECIAAAKYAPMAGNNFTLKFILVSDSEKIEKISENCEQPFINQAKYVVVVCSVPARIVNAYGKQGEVFARQQAGAAIENFLLKIEEEKLSTCWVGYFSERLMKEALSIPEDAQIEAVFPIGYTNERGKKRLKPELDSMLFFEKYGNKKMKKENYQET